MLPGENVDRIDHTDAEVEDEEVCVGQWVNGVYISMFNQWSWVSVKHSYHVY